ncbi:MAG: DUF3601 domain-containing protein [Nevskiaceae bacterium]|jgi:hypothetical protein|nr:DUF3601 domain-containing protein [Nevskiaceae bacterium]
MYGPQAIGYWSSRKAPNNSSKYQHLNAGKRYHVTREFLDYDRSIHPVGENWMFMGSSFLPYEDGWSLFVSPDGKHEWMFRMQSRPEEQAAILNSLAEYVAEEPLA